MARTRGKPADIELTAMGVELNTGIRGANPGSVGGQQAQEPIREHHTV